MNCQNVLQPTTKKLEVKNYTEALKKWSKSAIKLVNLKELEYIKN